MPACGAVPAAIATPSRSGAPAGDTSVASQIIAAQGLAACGRLDPGSFEHETAARQQPSARARQGVISQVVDRSAAAWRPFPSTPGSCKRGRRIWRRSARCTISDANVVAGSAGMAASHAPACGPAFHTSFGERTLHCADRPYPELAQGGAQSLCVLGCETRRRWNASAMSLVRRLIALRSCQASPAVSGPPPNSLGETMVECAPHGSAAGHRPRGTRPSTCRARCQPWMRGWHSRLPTPSAGSHCTEYPALTRDRAMGTDHLDLKTGRRKKVRERRLRRSATCNTAPSRAGAPACGVPSRGSGDTSVASQQMAPPSGVAPTNHKVAGGGHLKRRRARWCVRAIAGAC